MARGIARIAVRARTFVNYQAAVKQHWTPALGAFDLGAITRIQIKAVTAAMTADGKAASTIRNALVPLCKMLGDAVKDDLIKSNPAARIEIPQAAQEQTREIVPPSPEQVASILAKMRSEDSREAMRVAAAVGLRRGELFAVRWGDLDFSKNLIAIHASNYAGKIEETTKSKAGRRSLPIFRSIRKMLLERRARQQFSTDGDFIFGTCVGTPMDPNNFVRREWRRR